ncbi:MAG TPA: cytochrome c1 [Gammaproteobacteria bacterium]|nr:cytochrome c1 [Gammaproteobacteria bacterium]
MRPLILVMFFVVFLPVQVLASGGNLKLDAANIQLDDREAIKRGAKLFVNYCLNCHSASLMRYSRIGQDLEMSNEELGNQLIKTGAKVGDLMRVSIAPQDAKRWFGTAVPDLSVIARARGVDWLYTYLRSFYRDDSRPWGVNNTVFKDVGMPHVLWELQGLQEPIIETHKDAEGNETEVITGFKLIQKGKLDPAEYDATVHDLVTFLAYLSEPSKLQRLALGKWVLLFLAVFFVLVYLLKKEYWRDVH